jgi:hypothetical protein
MVAACGDDEDPAPLLDSSTPLDGSMMADAEAGAPPEDAAIQDTGTPAEDAAMDAGSDSAVEVDSGQQDAGTDASSSDVTQAVPGMRCALSERVGLIEIRGAYLYATIYDRPNAAIGEPEIDGEVCDFHRAPTAGGACDACDYDVEICGAGNTCALAQHPVDDVVIDVIKGASSETFESDDEGGSVYGELTLQSPIGLEARWGTQMIALAEQAQPSGLTDPAGTLMGSYDMPESVDITWSGASAGFVFTHVPINHHIGGLTFTECIVPAAEGEMHIDGEVLMPLADGTGLEFQGIAHVSFAAAQTDAGCVEIRYVTDQFISLF